MFFPSACFFVLDNNEAMPPQCSPSSEIANKPKRSSAEASLTVYFDGACPLCRREISLYQGIAPEQVQWQDVSANGALPDGLTRAEALARFHVCDASGRVLSGAAAFVALWAQLPGWRGLAGLARVPGALWLMEWAYRLFLRFRPRVQAWVRRWERRS